MFMAISSEKSEWGWVKKFEHLLDVLHCERRASGGRGPCQARQVIDTELKTACAAIFPRVAYGS
jgi:hypothetical protein